MKFKIVLILLVSIFLSGCASKHEGEFDYSDCREKIQIKQNDLSMILRDFTCEYDKNSDDKIYGGECVSFDIKNNKCNKVYIYKPKPEFNCKNENEFKISSYGECECKNQFMNGGYFSSKTNKCIDGEDFCKTEFGNNWEFEYRSNSKDFATRFENFEIIEDKTKIETSNFQDLSIPDYYYYGCINLLERSNYKEKCTGEYNSDFTNCMKPFLNNYFKDISQYKYEK